ncbi:MAG: DNA-packaging protein [Oscillospiraceae bacterium]|nr:DNA-packaging protein [Oscillospiraceae bacterium]
MNREVMKSRLSALTGETDDNILLTFLDIAAEKVLSKCYPFRRDDDDDINDIRREVPAKYHGTQLEIAVYLLNKRGAEGETAHNENGINRSYESASVPDSMLKGIVPFVSVLL